MLLSQSITIYDFFKGQNAVNLKEEILNTIKYLDIGKFLHLGMDGAARTGNVLDLINGHRVADGFQKTLEIGLCSLHIVYGVFQTAMIKPG